MKENELDDVSDIEMAGFLIGLLLAIIGWIKQDYFWVYLWISSVYGFVILSGLKSEKIENQNMIIGTLPVIIFIIEMIKTGVPAYTLIIFMLFLLGSLLTFDKKGFSEEHKSLFSLLYPTSRTVGIILIQLIVLLVLWFIYILLSGFINDVVL